MKTNNNSEQELKQTVQKLQIENHKLETALREREELMANMFSYLQNFTAKKQS